MFFDEQLPLLDNRGAVIVVATPRDSICVTHKALIRAFALSYSWRSLAT